ANGIELQGGAFDTFVAANLITKEWQSASLKNVSRYFLNEEMLTYDDVVKTYKYKDFSYVPLDLATWYAAADSLQTFKLVSILQKELEKEPALKNLYYSLEHPLIQILYKMEREGIYLNV